MNKENFRHYTLGIPEIDDEHWQLFDLLNSIRGAIAVSDKVTAKNLVDEFLFY